MQRRSYLAGGGVFLLPGVCGCVGGITDGSDDGSAESDDDAAPDEHEFNPYSVTVTAARGDGDLAIEGRGVQQATSDNPAIVAVTVENQADTRRRYAPTLYKSVPFNGRSFAHESGDGGLNLRIMSNENDDFERHGACWHYFSMPDVTGALEYEPGEVADYYLGVAGRSIDQTMDEPDGTACLREGSYVGTQTLTAYASTDHGFDPEEDRIGEIELELELEVARD